VTDPLPRFLLIIDRRNYNFLSGYSILFDDNISQQAWLISWELYSYCRIKHTVNDNANSQLSRVNLRLKLGTRINQIKSRICYDNWIKQTMSTQYNWKESKLNCKNHNNLKVWTWMQWIRSDGISSPWVPKSLFCFSIFREKCGIPRPRSDFRNNIACKNGP
jgi:hypothetical protein